MWTASPADWAAGLAGPAVPQLAPGEGCRYCNVGNVLLGLMIERATGSTYREYVAAVQGVT